ncbi:hypothetical protein N7510_000474 [Penicillium lagena]|uniref:uncharacterized protein n=1 Tax=Penicillium lagena TaxID=94218 RepID=UPI0025425FEF|nr:uncharacterized protein N7510_000474 [Penicillium lagena]KAJ5624165.1 hypothetical protein N7510_000474 [Penicillium lagena]
MDSFGSKERDVEKAITQTDQVVAASDQLPAKAQPLPPIAAERGKGKFPTPSSHIRVARPVKSLAAAEQFWVNGLGLEVLWRTDLAPHPGEGGHYLLMVGWKDAAWHLELVQVNDDDPEIQPRPTEEDLLVLYLEGPVDETVVGNLVQAGGKRVTARNSYWETWGVTIEDPDGYRVVLCQRKW